MSKSKHQTNSPTLIEDPSTTIQLLQEAANIKSIPNIELDVTSLNKLKKLWSSTLNISHNLSFDSWLKDSVYIVVNWSCNNALIRKILGHNF